MTGINVNQSGSKTYSQMGVFSFGRKDHSGELEESQQQGQQGRPCQVKLSRLTILP